MKNNTRKIILALILVFTIIMSFATVSVFAAEDSAEGTTVYLKPDTNWLTDSPRFAIYAWGTGVDAAWVNMKASETAGVYEGVVPAGYTDIIFCRMNPNVTENRWNTDTDTGETKPLWNQTVDLKVTANGTFTITNPWDSSANGNATGTWGDVTSGGSGSGSGSGSTTTPDVGDLELAVGDYYLAGYINGADYGIVDDAANLGSYKFVNGKLTMTLSSNSYVVVKDSSNNVYGTQTYVSGVNSATFVQGGGEKMLVPSGEVSFTLYKGDNGALVLAYTVKEGTGGTTDVPTIDDTKTVTVYVGNSAGWETVYYYCWVSGGSAYVEWPGLEMDLNEDGYWSAEVPVACDNVIFNDGMGNQTIDLKTPTDNKNVCDTAGCLKDGTVNAEYWFTKADYKPSTPVIKENTDREVTLVLKNDANWEQVYVYYWPIGGTNENWPGELLTPAEDGLYYAVIPEGNGYVIFNNGSDEAKTADMVIPTDDNVLYNNATDSWSEMKLAANQNQGGGTSGGADAGDDGAPQMTWIQKIAKAILLFLRSIEDFFKGLFPKK